MSANLQVDANGCRPRVHYQVLLAGCGWQGLGCVARLWVPGWGLGQAVEAVQWEETCKTTQSVVFESSAEELATKLCSNLLRLPNYAPYDLQPGVLQYFRRCSLNCDNIE